MQAFSGTLKKEELPDGRHARLTEEFWYRDKKGNKHIAHKGFVYDGGSIPRFFWRVIGPPFTGKARYAYPIHDVECKRARDIALDTDPEMGEAFRKKADLTFIEMLEFLGVPWWKRRIMYRGVRLGAWNEKRKGWRIDK